MDMNMKYLVVGLLLLVVAMALAACGQAAPAPVQETAAPAPTQACPEVPEATACPAPPEPVVADVPFEEQWAASPHNDLTAEAFIHWNEDDPAEVPESCAKCHSTPGYLDFLGADGTAAGTVDAPAEIGTTVQCAACHNDVTVAKTSVVFPSGIEITDLGDQSRCMECHQGRASSVQVDEAITENVGEEFDTVNEELGFINIHYFAAAATRLGTEVKGGYEYSGKTYDARFDHIAGYDTCISCHNPHTLEVKVDECAACHTGVASVEDLRNVRMQGSIKDYDGDGDLSEGIAFEIEGLQGMLMTAIQAYATEVSGTAIIYDAGRHPYFFIDSNANGSADEDEVNSDNSYNAWTGRLVKAAYNYQTSLKDPGAFAHGGKYIIELLYDSIEDLNTQISTPVDLSTASRLDAGHFASSEEPFRHWDEEGLVPGDCAKCHSASGLPTFLGEASRNRDGVTGVTVAVHPSSGLNCATCHDDVSTFTRRLVEQVKFPSGAVVDIGNPDSNLCLNCHQGRESTVSVNAAIQRAAAASDDMVSEALSFRNPHYFAAGATLLGTEAKGAYEYDGKTYNPRFTHVPDFQSCVNCHDTHALTVRVEACSGCHTGVTSVEDLQTIRMTEGDFDGDGDETEGLAQEVATMEDEVYLAMQAYAMETSGTGIVYDAHAYPYFFADTNGNGEADEDEVNSDNSYSGWTPRLLRAAYNFQWVAKDPGAFAHNGQYILQVLYDSLEDLGGDVAGKTRPETPPPPAP
jgi:hypothetical protein